MNARERYPSVLQAIGLLLLAFVVSGVAGAALGALTKLTPRHPFILAGANLAGISLVLAWGARKFQPLCFNLLGAALVTTGIALLIRGFRRAGYAPLRAAEASAAGPSAGPPEKSR